MASYNYNGQVYDLPDGMDPNHAAEVLKQVAGPPQVTPSASAGGSNPDVTQQLQAPTTGTLAPNPTEQAGTLGPQDSIDPDTLVHDKDWLDASRRIYKYNNPNEFDGSDADLAEYGLDTIGWMKYNLPYLAVSAARLTSADQDTKLAMVHMLEKYDNLQMSWKGAGRFVTGAALDPTNWTGLASMGIGTVASGGAKLASMAALKEMLKAGLVGAVDAAVITGTQNTLEQNIKLNAGTQKDFNYGELATSAGTGAVVGEVLGAGARGVGKLLGKETGIFPVAPPSAKPSAAEALQSAAEAVGSKVDLPATTLPDTTAKAPPASRQLIAANENVGPVQEASHELAAAADPVSQSTAFEKLADAIEPHKPKIITAANDSVKPGSELQKQNYETGKPIVLNGYHGTGKTFDKFDTTFGGSGAGGSDSERGTIFIARHPDTANSYVEHGTEHVSSPLTPLHNEYKQKYNEFEQKWYPPGLYDLKPGEKMKDPKYITGEYDYTAPHGGLTPEFQAEEAKIQELSDAVYDEKGSSEASSQGQQVRPTRVIMENPLVVNYKSEYGIGSYEGSVYNHILDRAEAAGHDGVIIKGVRDGGGISDDVFISLDAKKVEGKYDEGTHGVVNEGQAIHAADTQTMKPDDFDHGMVSANDNTPIPKGQSATVTEPEAIGSARPTGPAANENVDLGANGSGVPPAEPPAPNSIIAALKQYAGDTGARIFSHWDKMGEDSQAATKIIMDLKPDEAKSVIEAARRGELNPEATVLAKAAFASATQKLGDELAANRTALDLLKKQKGGDPRLIQELQNRADDLQALYDNVRSVDMAFSSITGHELRNRVGMTNTNDFRDVSPDSIIRERKLEPALYGKNHPIRKEAEAEFQRRLINHQEQIEHDATVMKLEQEANDLFFKDPAASILKNEEANAMREARALKLAEDNPASFNAKLAGVAHTGWQAAVEYVISTVFKTSTLLVNLVPSLILTPIRPMVDFMVRGGGSEAYAMMTASYSMMHLNVHQALQAAVASFRYEADLLGKHGPDSANKFLESSGIIPGVYGRIIRTFPRLLTATDQFFKRMNYTSYVSSYSASEAFKDGLQLGLKKGTPEMKAFIDGVVHRSVSHAFSPPEHGISVLNFLRQQGIRRGIETGPKLNQFIQQELSKNGNLLTTAASESGRMFADDMAFRREFSGNGFTSSMAQGYEKFTNKHPWMKFFGQLFFRTPVRVFEEGIRLTPGIQFAAPGFFRDLRGAGIGGAGGTAQVRAQAEAMAALAFAGATFNAYSQGKITGGGQTDWRLGKNQVNSGYQPYTYKFDDGTNFNFRNFDPFATPFKIMVNALDHLTELEYRHAQGEDLDQTAYQQAAAHVYMPALAVIQSIKDANLAEGLSELVELGHDLSDPTKSGDAFTRFAARKAQLLVPNQYTTIAQITMDNGADFHDPKTFDQYILARVNPGAGTIPKRYDPLGNNLENANPMSGLWGVPITTTKAQRDKALDTKSQAVNQVLGAISVATNATFIPGYTAAQWAAGSGFPTGGLEGLDLRTKLTADGKETMYDRLNRYVQQSALKDKLYDTLVKETHAMGTPSGKGPAAEAAHLLITDYRGQAFVRLAKEEPIFQPLVRAAAMQKAYSEGGLREAGGAPFQ